MRYYEDLSVGERYHLGPYEMTESEIVDFADKYDPQPFHIDPESAAETSHQGLIASGWHTGSVCMRLVVDGILYNTAIIGSPGINELHWNRPVRPGNNLEVEVEVTNMRQSESRPSIGLVKTAWEATNEANSTVMTFDTIWFIDQYEEQ